jgi:tetratricopeptide (TPR) repeat protein
MLQKKMKNSSKNLFNKITEWYQKGEYLKITESIDFNSISEDILWIVLDSYVNLEKQLEASVLLNEWKEKLISKDKARWYYYSAMLARTYAQPVKALEYLQKGKKHLIDKNQLLGALIGIEEGRNFYIIGEFVNALNSFFTAKLALEKLNDIDNNKIQLAKVLHGIGYVFLLQGNFNDSLNYLEEALEIKRKSNNFQEIGRSLLVVAQIYYFQANLELAEKYFRHALKLFETNENPRLVGMTLNWLGNVFRDRGDYDMALMAFNSSLELFYEVENQNLWAWSLVEIGRVYQDEGQLDKAYKFMKEGLNFFEQLNDPRSIGEVIFKLTYLKKEMGTLQPDLEIIKKFPKPPYKIPALKGFKLLIDALLAENQKNYGIAEKAYFEALKYESVPFYAQIICLESLINLAFKEWRGNPDKEKKELLMNRIENLESLSKEQNLSSKADMFLYKAKICLSELDLEEADYWLNKSLMISQNKGLPKKQNQIEVEIKNLDKIKSKLASLSTNDLDVDETHLTELFSILKKTNHLVKDILHSSGDYEKKTDEVSAKSIQPSAKQFILSEKSIKLKVQQEQILNLLKNNPFGILQRDLPKMTLLSKSTISRRVNELVDLGLIQRIQKGRALNLMLANTK